MPADNDKAQVNDAAHSAWQQHLHNQMLGFIQQARMLKIGLLIATENKEVSESVLKHLYSEAASIAAICQEKKT